MIQKTLQSIGLSHKEIKIYLVSLKLGPQPASNIARRTQIVRATVYDVFDSLIKKGLADKRDRGGVTLFEVSPPESLVHFIEQEKQDFIRQKNQEKQDLEEVLPLLKSIEIETTTRPKVQFFEGEKGLQKAYEKTLTTKDKLIRAYANVEEMHKGLPNFFPEYYDRRTKANIHINTVVPDNEAGLHRHSLDHQERRTCKMIDHKKFNFSPEINVFDNQVLYASWKEKMAVLIESEEIAEFHRQMFDLLWEKLD